VPIESSSLELPNQPISNSAIKPIELELSSDPIASNLFATENFFAAVASGINSRRPNYNQNGKRTAFSFSAADNNNNAKQARFATLTTTQLARELVLQARDLLIQASLATQLRDEQSKLLDLLEIFREYTEQGKLRTASTIITSQIANLESATRQIETKAKALAKVPIHESNQSINNNNKAVPQEWTLVKSKQKTKSSIELSKTKAKNLRLVLVTSLDVATKFSPLALRNAFNQAFANKGVKNPVVNTITKSMSQNLVVTTTS
ncbi:hypothetical protein B0O99DRAFT_714823, partial [Bisporella sp. PMI_857]